MCVRFRWSCRRNGRRGRRLQSEEDGAHFECGGAGSVLHYARPMTETRQGMAGIAESLPRHGFCRHPLLKLRAVFLVELTRRTGADRAARRNHHRRWRVQRTTRRRWRGESSVSVVQATERGPAAQEHRTRAHRERRVPRAARRMIACVVMPSRLAPVSFAPFPLRAGVWGRCVRMRARTGVADGARRPSWGCLRSAAAEQLHLDPGGRHVSPLCSADAVQPGSRC